MNLLICFIFANVQDRTLIEENTDKYVAPLLIASGITPHVLFIKRFSPIKQDQCDIVLQITNEKHSTKCEEAMLGGEHLTCERFFIVSGDSKHKLWAIFSKNGICHKKHVLAHLTGESMEIQYKYIAYLIFKMIKLDIHKYDRFFIQTQPDPPRMHYMIKYNNQAHFYGMKNVTKYLSSLSSLSCLRRDKLEEKEPYTLTMTLLILLGMQISTVILLGLKCPGNIKFTVKANDHKHSYESISSLDQSNGCSVKLLRINRRLGSTELPSRPSQTSAINSFNTI